MNLQYFQTEKKRFSIFFFSNARDTHLRSFY